MIELIITNNQGELQSPVVVGEVILDRFMRYTPSKLAFKVLKTEGLSFHEGNSVLFRYGGKHVFFGFVFSKKRNKEEYIEVTCYDQLIYLSKNKDSINYKDKSTSDLLKFLCAENHLRIGDISNTSFPVSRDEDNTSYLEMIKNSVDVTLQNTKKLFVIYDDFGKITLKNIEDMKIDLVIADNNSTNFGYTSTIDQDTYNQVKLVYEDTEKGKREIFIEKDSKHINAWGVLQKFDTVKKGEDAVAKAQALLTLHNQVQRKLKISGVVGNTDIRGGTMLVVKLNLGDMEISKYMVVDSCKHKFKEDEYFVDVNLFGGGFSA